MAEREENRGHKTRRAISASVAIMSLIGVGLVVYWELGNRRSPGPLHPSHAAVRELRGASSCARCHGENDVNMAESCVACHSEIGSQMKEGAGLHGIQAVTHDFDCRACHKDHLGAAVNLVTDLSWSLANLSPTTPFAHADLVEFTLTDAHDSVDCQSCHKQAHAASLVEGEFRFMGLAQECSSCHEDIHEGTYGNDCASCHGQAEPFSKVAQFAHTDKFRLFGSHSGLECSACHDPAGDHPVSTLLKEAPITVRNCAVCHDSPHTSEFLPAVSRITGTAEGETCSICHSVEHDSFSGPQATMPLELHEASGFVIAVPHTDVTCVQCHEGYEVEASADQESDVVFSEVYPGRKQDECIACHTDPHLGQFNAGFTQGLCVRCHATTHFDPPNFGVDMHDNTAFPLTGNHRDVGCAECHDYDSEPVMFPPVAKDCADCHEDIHRGAFDGPNRPSTANGKLDCARCHNTSGFENIAWRSTEHAMWTGYALDGGHAKVACAQCHKVSGSYTARYASTSRECATCHEDVHGGAFNSIQVAATANQQGCAQCHSTESFSATEWSVADHANLAKYPLLGEHATASCDDCHTIDASGDFPQRTFGFAARACASCHEDSHGGQFASEGKNDCGRCHNPALAFTSIEFDHQSASRFPLDEFHSSLDCGQCHVPYKTTAGDFVIRYKPLGTKCQDCHTFSSREEAARR